MEETILIGRKLIEVQVSIFLESLSLLVQSFLPPFGLLGISKAPKRLAAPPAFPTPSISCADNTVPKDTDGSSQREDNTACAKSQSVSTEVSFLRAEPIGGVNALSVQVGIRVLHATFSVDSSWIQRRRTVIYKV